MIDDDLGKALAHLRAVREASISCCLQESGYKRLDAAIEILVKKALRRSNNDNSPVLIGMVFAALSGAVMGFFLGLMF